MRWYNPRAALVVLVVALAVGCADLTDHDAERKVMVYNERLIEAYQLGDAEIMEGIVGDEEARKLTGLIGAKLDMGITLDSKLEEFRTLRVEREDIFVNVLTEERWSYRDRRIGTGETVGRPSEDHYLMRYALNKIDDKWLVVAVKFEEPPVVGRAEAPVAGSAAMYHGLATATPEESEH